MWHPNVAFVPQTSHELSIQMMITVKGVGVIIMKLRNLPISSRKFRVTREERSKVNYLWLVSSGHRCSRISLWALLAAARENSHLHTAGTLMLAPRRVLSMDWWADAEQQTLPSLQWLHEAWLTESGPSQEAVGWLHVWLPARTLPGTVPSMACIHHLQ